MGFKERNWFELVEKMKRWQEMGYEAQLNRSQFVFWNYLPGREVVKGRREKAEGSWMEIKGKIMFKAMEKERGVGTFGIVQKGLP